MPISRILGLFVAAVAILTMAARPAADPSRPDTIDEQIDRMSTSDRIAQLMIVGIQTETREANIEKILASIRVGGVVLYAANLGPIGQVRQITAAIRRGAGPVAPFIAVDQEGGIVTRLQHGVPLVPSNMALGAAASADLARRTGVAVGVGLRRLGFTMNFAPVLDVLPDSGPSALHTRAFSHQPGIVADLGVAFVRGQRAAGIIPVAKHFPGQGRAVEDSHRVLPVVDVSPEDLAMRDLVPFRRAIEDGLPAIMTGHIAVPRVTGRNDLAATLSSDVVTTILRKDLRFEGLVISDALEMKALSQAVIGETAVRAVMAGCDMVLVAGPPHHRTVVFTELRRAYERGTLSETRLRQSLRRILGLKAVTLDTPAMGAIDNDIEREIAQRAVTVIGDRQLLAVATRTPVYVGPPGELERGVRTSDAVILPSRITESTRRELRDAVTRVLAKAPAWIGAARTAEHWEFLAEMRSAFPDVPMIYVNLGSPYRTIEGGRVVSVLTYSSSLESQRVAAQVLDGTIVPTGVLPVSLPPATTGVLDPAQTAR